MNMRGDEGEPLSFHSHSTNPPTLLISPAFPREVVLNNPQQNENTLSTCMRARVRICARAEGWCTPAFRM